MSIWGLLVAAWLATIASSMPSVDYRQVPIKEKALHQPPMQEVADVLSKGLRSTFATVRVTVEHCPDLTQSPYNLTSPGLAGNPKLVEIGGQSYIQPLIQRDKIYDMAELVRYLQRDPAFLIGAGTGPWPYIGVGCEGTVNLSIKNGVVDQGSRIVSVEPVGAPKSSARYLQRRLPNSETRSTLLGNYLLSAGKPGKVIKVVAKKRTGPSNFITAIRETLKNHYGDKVVGLGGTFVLLGGKVMYHVMPDFSRTPLCSESDNDAWLYYFEMKAPITNVGTLVTGDHGLDLRAEHFHGFSAHGDGGHYHYDTTPDDAHYEGYFVLAASAVRVDAPKNTHTVGRD